MNCRPHELAIVVLPESEPEWLRRQVNDMVVTTLRLLPHAHVALWELAPQLSIVAPMMVMDSTGRVFRGPARINALPDNYLRPIRPDSREDKAPAQRDVMSPKPQKEFVLRLQVNNSGAWKNVVKFSIADVELVKGAANQLGECAAGVVLHWSHARGWHVPRWAVDYTWVP